MENVENSLTVNVFKVKKSDFCVAYALEQEFIGSNIEEDKEFIIEKIERYIKDNLYELSLTARKNGSKKLFDMDNKKKNSREAYYDLKDKSKNLYNMLMDEVNEEKNFLQKLAKSPNFPDLDFYDYVERQEVPIDTTEFNKEYITLQEKFSEEMDQSILNDKKIEDAAILKQEKIEAGVLCPTCDNQNILPLAFDFNKKITVLACKDCATQWYGIIKI